MATDTLLLSKSRSRVIKSTYKKKILLLSLVASIQSGVLNCFIFFHLRFTVLPFTVLS